MMGVARRTAPRNEGATIMHPVMAKDEIRWAEMRHQERLAKAESNLLAGKRHESKQPEGIRSGRVTLTAKLATALILFVAFGAFVAVVVA
jgi:hypothetical protein